MDIDDLSDICHYALASYVFSHLSPLTSYLLSFTSYL